MKILGSGYSPTPKGGRKAGVSQKCLHVIFKGTEIAFDFTVLRVSIWGSNLKSNTTTADIITQLSLTKLRCTIDTNGTNPIPSNQLYSSFSIAIEGISITFLLKRTKVPKMRMIFKY